MTCVLLVTQDWEGIVARLGGAAALEQSARGTKAFAGAGHCTAGICCA